MNKSSWICLIALTCCARSALPAEYYVDPKLGSAENDGSNEKPWKSLQDVVDRGLISSQQWSSLPFGAGNRLVPKNPRAPIKAGDTILLRSGFHGQLSIQDHYNIGPITIAAQEGHVPRFSRIRIRSSAFWTLRGLHVSPQFADTYETGTLIDLDAHGFRGPVRNIVIEACRLMSVEDSSEWTAQDWNKLACNGIDVDGRNMTVRNCTLRNVNFGISVSASHSLIERNTVENFAGDGMRGLGDYSTFQYNTVKNCYDVNHNHDDGFQSWSRGSEGRVGTGEVRGIVLRGNTIINYEDRDQPHRGALQGIGCFDGMFVDWVIENNVIVVDHFHGITLSGARGCRIVNNTVVDCDPEYPGPPWILVDKHKNGTASSDCIIRNNLTTSVSQQPGVSLDHNLVVTDPERFFANIHARDLRLRADSPAVDAGSSDLAPQRDIVGTIRPRGSAVDVGAFESR